MQCKVTNVPLDIARWGKDFGALQSDVSGFFNALDSYVKKVLMCCKVTQKGFLVHCKVT